VADEQDQELQSPFDKLLGLRIQEASGDRVVAVLPVTPDLHQPTGLVHGGVYATVVETTASVGATLWLAGRGQAFGISNHTDFLRPVRDGDLRVEATPLSRGRTTQLWQVSVTDERGRGVAHGKVRLFNSEQVPGSAGRA
jgi:1,4-dihydroxy-2-naphthoyl-CoA hydrolase